MNYLDALNWRFATTHFSDKDVSEDDLHDLLEAARLAPGSYNIQPWKMVVTRDKEVLKKLLPVSYNQPQVETAPVVVTFCANKNLTEAFDRVVKNLKETGATEEDLAQYIQAVNDLINSMDDDAQHAFADRQMYIALGNFLSAAALKQIDAGPMEGLDPQGVAEVLELEDNFIPRAQVAVGYRQEDPSQPKFRNPLDDMVDKRY